MAELQFCKGCSIFFSDNNHACESSDRECAKSFVDKELEKVNEAFKCKIKEILQVKQNYNEILQDLTANSTTERGRIMKEEIEKDPKYKEKVNNIKEEVEKKLNELNELLNTLTSNFYEYKKYYTKTKEILSKGYVKNITYTSSKDIIDKISNAKLNSKEIKKLDKKVNNLYQKISSILSKELSREDDLKYWNNQLEEESKKFNIKESTPQLLNEIQFNKAKYLLLIVELKEKQNIAEDIKCHKLYKEKKALETDLKKIKKEVDVYRQEEVRCRNLCKENKEQYASLLKEHLKLKNEFKRLTKKHKDELNESEEQLNSIKENLKKTRKEYDEYKNKTNSLKEELNSVTKEFNKLNNIYGTLFDNIVQLKVIYAEESEKLKGLVESANKYIEEFNEKIKNNEEKLELLKKLPKDLCQLENEKIQLNKELRVLQDNKEKTQVELNDLINDCEEQKGKLIDKDRIIRYRNTILKIKKSIEDIKSECVTLDDFKSKYFSIAQEALIRLNLIRTTYINIKIRIYRERINAPTII